MSEKERFLGINHVALEVADIDEALRFYGAILRAALERAAFRHSLGLE